MCDWKRVLEAGDHLLTVAGDVQTAAEALWDARAAHGLDNLKGVNSKELDSILHPLLLEYLRSVGNQGMVARHLGSDQIFKDVKKHRVLVTRKNNKNLGVTVSSPFEAVDKMLPDRTIAAEKRVVHDQRGVNKDTDKTWHFFQLSNPHISRSPVGSCGTRRGTRALRYGSPSGT